MSHRVCVMATGLALVAACRGNAAPNEGAAANPALAKADAEADAKTEADAKKAAKADAKADAKVETTTAPIVATTTGADVDGGAALDEVEDRPWAQRNGVPLPFEASPEQIERLWPGTKARPEDEESSFIIVTDAKGTALLQFAEEGPTCFLGAGVTNSSGFTVGQPLSKAPHQAHMICEIATGDDLLHMGLFCPEYYAETKLVCETEEGGFQRLFFHLDSARAGRQGEEVRPDELAEFATAELTAVLEMDAELEPEPPRRPPVAHRGPVIVLARIKGAAAHELRSNTPMTRAGLEAAIPGSRARKRRDGGFNLHLGDDRVAEIRGKEGWVASARLLGPGLVDPVGIEVGVKIAAVARISDLECESSADEGSIGYVSCTSSTNRVRYTFELGKTPDLLDSLSVAKAKKLVGARPLSRVAVWRAR